LAFGPFQKETKETKKPHKTESVRSIDCLPFAFFLFVCCLFFFLCLCHIVHQGVCTLWWTPEHANTISMRVDLSACLSFADCLPTAMSLLVTSQHTHPHTLIHTRIPPSLRHPHTHPHIEFPQRAESSCYGPGSHPPGRHAPASQKGRSQPLVVFPITHTITYLTCPISHHVIICSIPAALSLRK
jgi:hypothetical protein